MLDCHSIPFGKAHCLPPASVAQLAEHLTLNQQVVGSSPTGGTDDVDYLNIPKHSAKPSGFRVHRAARTTANAVLYLKVSTNYRGLIDHYASMHNLRNTAKSRRKSLSRRLVACYRWQRKVSHMVLSGSSSKASTPATACTFSNKSNQQLDLELLAVCLGRKDLGEFLMKLQELSGSVNDTPSTCAYHEDSVQPRHPETPSLLTQEKLCNAPTGPALSHIHEPDRPKNY